MKKKLKIAIIFRPDVRIQIPTLGGMSNFVYFLSKGLKARGHDVTVFGGRNSKLARGVKLEKCLINEDGANIYDAGENFRSVVKKGANSLDEAINMSFGDLSKRFDYKIEHYLSAFSKIKAGNFDAVHIISYEIVGLYPALFSVVPAVVSFHGHHDYYSKEQKRWLDFVKDNYKSLNCSFVSVSRFIQKEYVKFIKSELIYNAIDIKPYKLQKNKKDYIAFLGRIDAKKGLEFTIKFSKKYQVPLIIAGNISNKWYFEDKIKPYIDSKLIKFIGLVNEKQKNKLLGGAKCFFMPTRYKEAFGRVIVEALACGTPVIGFKNGAVPELVINNKTGFVIKEDDMGGAKKAFDKIEQIKPEVCRKFVEDNFTIERLAGEYEALYRKISN
ncbi:MAG: glycosyltransferase [Patescibacteria group bacterium]|jgi:glycosyltransferase involved in cell wall biosynthesis